MEREFLKGIDYRIYIHPDMYGEWVNYFLKDLVAAKGRDERQWRWYCRQSLHAYSLYASSEPNNMN